MLLKERVFKTEILMNSQAACEDKIHIFKRVVFLFKEREGGECFDIVGLGGMMHVPVVDEREKTFIGLVGGRKELDK